MNGNATAEYTRNSVLASSPGQIIVMMYDGAIRFVRQALHHLREGRTADCGVAISKAFNVVSELKVSLDFEAGGDEARELVSRLDGLYGYVMDELVKANTDRTERQLESAIEVLATLREGWVEAVRNA